MKKFICLLVLIILLLLGCAKTPLSSQSESITLLSNASLQSSQVESFALSSTETSDQNIKSNGEYEYKIVDNSVTIVKYIDYAKDVVVPDTIDGFPVKVIGDHAFFGRQGVKTLKLPESVEEIGAFAFSQTGIKDFVFPPKVKVISSCVFNESELERVTLPDNVQVIESGAFSISCLTEIFIPDSVTTFDESFYDCPRSLILFYDNNPIVRQHAKDCNLLCFKRSEYNPVLDVELVGGKPLNDDQNLGISKEVYNRISRRPMNDIEFIIDYILNQAEGFYHIAFERGYYNGYIRFMEGDDLSQEAIKQKLVKTATLLYQCGITEFDLKTVNTEEVGCFDKLITAIIYCGWPDQLENEIIKGSNLRFIDDDLLYVEAFGLFDFIPDDSLVTGYSEQQHGIWYYQKELPKVTTEVLSFTGNLDDGNFILKVKFTDNAGVTCEKTFSYSLVPYDSVSGDNYRVILKSIK